MASLGSLVIELAANTARLQSDLGRAVTIAERGAASMRKAFGFLGVAGGGGLAGSIFVRGALDAIRFGDEIDKAAKRAGIAAGEFSKLAAAGRQVDVEIATLSRAIKDMQVSIAEAARGSRAQIAALERLGVSLDQIRARPATEQLGILADALARVQDPSERARLGNELLRRSYLELTPLLEKGAEGIRALVREQEQLGNVFSDDEIRKLAEADEAIKKLGSAWAGLKTQVTVGIAPFLTAELEGFAQFAKAINRGESPLEFYRRLREEIEAAKKATAAPPRLADEAQEVLFTAKRLREGEFTPEEEKLATREFTPTARYFFELNPLTQRDMQRIREGAQESRAIFEDVWRDGFGRGMNLGPIMEEDLESIRFDEFGEALLESTEQIADEMSEVFSSPFGELTVYGEQAARNMQDAFADFLFDPFEDGLRGMLKGFIDVLRRMAAEAAAAKIFASKKDGGLGLGDFINAGLSSFLGLASGGPAKAGHPYIVGERGPELFVPSDSGVVVPNHKLGGMTLHVENKIHVDARADSGQVQAIVAQGIRIGIDASVGKVRELVRQGRI